ncbi:copper fist DNA binding domain-containing protein, partial [Lipomyces kononenkoae]
MVFIDGVKYACDTCIRGHRVTTCTHKDRPLTMIKPKGRPVSQCPHCREARKNHALHTKCDCTEHKPGSSPSKSVTCGCPQGGKCDCSKLKNAGRTGSAGAVVPKGVHEVPLKAGHVAGVRHSTTMSKPHLHGASPYGIVSTGNSPSPSAQVAMNYPVPPAQQHVENYIHPKESASPLPDANIASYAPLTLLDPMSARIADVAALCNLQDFGGDSTVDQETSG